MKVQLTIIALIFGLNLNAQDSGIVFKIDQSHWTEADSSINGRIFLIFSKEKPTSTFYGIPYPDTKMSPVFATDIVDWEIGNSIYLKGEDLYGFPIKSISDMPTGTWYVYAFFKGNNSGLLLTKAEQIYSTAVSVNIDSTIEQLPVELTIDKKLEDPPSPVNRKHFKYETLSSKLLTEFWNRPMLTRFQVMLPRTYYSEPERKYPLLIIIGGFGERYSSKIMSDKELLDLNTPQMIVILLDSKAPFGDSYQINSANNGPYGDVLVEEIIPFIESKYRCVGDSTSRFLTGTSTGGWASLALQIFYPEFFNGVWSTCADPVDFRQMELINIYKDDNAFINRYGLERPAMRDINGEPRYTIRTEVWAENILGFENSYHLSSGQWGSWNALFSPKDSTTGFPKMIFDAETGEINKDVAESWKKYDLRLYLSENWSSIGKELQGKLHIWMGTMDSFYLNNAMMLFDNFLKTTNNPKSDAEVNFILGEGHACDSNIPLNLAMKQMIERYEKSN